MKLVGGACAILILLGVLDACSSEDSSADPKSCPVGSEGCPCTQGGGCDQRLSCLSGFCVDATGVAGQGNTDAAASGGTGGGATGGSSGTATGGSSTGGSSGAGTGGSSGAATGGSGNVGGGGSGTGGSGGSSGCGTTSYAETCSYPASDGAVTENGDPKGTSKDTLDVKFASGQLVELDGECCAPDTSGTKPTGDWGSYPCVDGYVCGGCLVFLMDEDPQSPANAWTLLGAYSATNGDVAGCDELSGGYRICVPDCTGKVCGSDGCNGSCGACLGQHMVCENGACKEDACSVCLDACSGLPGCCTGTGCICDGACP
jgi:hypothetical protein